MNILFIHNNFPGQYRRIVEYLKRFPEVNISAATLKSNDYESNILRARFEPHREVTQGIHPAVVATEKAVILGQAAYTKLSELKKTMASPDIILFHSGPGASLFLRDLFPSTKLLGYFEWYYRSHGSDGEFLENEIYDANAELRIRMSNTPILHDLVSMDWGQTPTRFQQQQFPQIFQDKLECLHDGVDTNFFSPSSNTTVRVGNLVFTEQQEIITYVARGMEEYRGFPQFMEAVSELQKRRPNLQVIILGSDRVAYGASRKDGKSFRSWALSRFKFDRDRLHFLGLQPLGVFRDLMRISSAHIYLTVPFVLSWSLLEAMSSGALIVASDTPPVLEVIDHEINGLLVPFFDVEALVEQTNNVLDNQSEYQTLRENARRTILDHYDTADLLPRYKTLIENVSNGQKQKKHESLASR